MMEFAKSRRGHTSLFPDLDVSNSVGLGRDDVDSGICQM